MNSALQEFDYAADGKRAFECVRDGGVAIIQADAGYAIMSATDDALRRVYAGKQRSYQKGSAITACRDMAQAVHILSAEQNDIVTAITVEHNLPLGVVAPFRDNDPFMRKLTPFLFSVGTRDGTVSFLQNAGKLRDVVARHSWQEQVPILSSSANRSQHGVKYEVKDIEPEVIDAVDLVIDHGPAKYNKVKNVSTTLIDIRTMTLIRKGHCFEEIDGILRNRFGIVLKSAA